MEWAIRQNRLLAIERKLKRQHDRLWARTTEAFNGNLWHRYTVLSARCNTLAVRHNRVWSAVHACFPTEVNHVVSR